MAAFSAKSRILVAVMSLLLAAAGLLMFAPADSRAKQPAGMSAADREYLRKLAQDTWACIDYLTDKNTQLPYDNVLRGEYTSVSNIGLYAASVAAAVDFGFLDRREARERLGTLLDNIANFTQWNGFTQSWNNVHNGQPSTGDPWISTLDSGNYYAGLMVGRVYFPELATQFNRVIDVADWSKLYNPETNKLRFGYNRQKDIYNGDLNDLGSDARLAYFLAIGRDKIPATAWRSMNRNLEERYGLQYLQPGWQGGGLFMQFISGLILDEKDTFLGASAANFAYAQIVHARNQGYPVWGWSACAAPGGEYLGMGALKDSVVTPHASVLALKYYPRLALANLKALEAMGARKPFQGFDFGFRDSIDFKTKAVADNYLLLDQCMLFLALSNFLQDDFIVKAFKQDAVARKGYKVIPDLQALNIVDELAGRDSQTVPGAVLAEPGVKVKPYAEKSLQSANAIHTPAEVKLDGDLSEWADAQPVLLGKDTFADLETLPDRDDLGATCYFMWDDTYLYFAAKVRDNLLRFTKTGALIWQDDCIELYIAPQQNNFVWGTRNNYQIGLAAGGPDGKPQAWAWFQDGDPGDNVRLAAKQGDAVADGQRGYIIEARIRWDFLLVKPYPSEVIGVSPAVHWIDANKQELKLNWSFLYDGKSLGKLTLLK
jgi:hypothetical protein